MMLQAILRGVRRAAPMGIGYVVIGFSVAATAFGAGIDARNTVLMSIFVCAGTSQLIAVKMLGDGVALGPIIVTTLIVNLRHLLMSSSLAPHLRNFGGLARGYFCFTLFDESFAMHSAAIANGHRASKAEMLAANATLHVAWVAGAVIAVVAQTDASFLARFGLDYAPAAMFIALLALLVRDGTQWGVAAFCGVGSVLLARLGVGAEAVMVTTVVGASLGTWGETWISKRSSLPSSA